MSGQRKRGVLSESIQMRVMSFVRSMCTVSAHILISVEKSVA